AETSLIESVLDFQFEVLTTHLNDGGKRPERSAVNNAHAYLAAPYGIYRTTDGFLAIAMTPIPRLGELLGCEPLARWTDPASWFTDRDAIKAELAAHLAGRSTADWLSLLEPADVWCADVLDWPRLLQHEGFKALAMTQHVARQNGAALETTRCPIRIDGGILTSDTGAPTVGQHTESILRWVRE
ncbi:MAG: CoA transferase, partial [Thermomicrobiales bacterium]